MAIVHIVLFKFKSTASTEAVANLTSKMLALQADCVLPDTKKPYIMNSSGGLNNSPEGLEGGCTHGFVIIFNNQADRNYYVDKDPAHKEVQEEAKLIVEKVIVFDYEPNAF